MFSNKIDRLQKIQDKLKYKIEQLKSNTNFNNSKIEAKIKHLEEKAFSNRTTLDTKVEILELRLTKNANNILAEAEYANQLGAKYKTNQTETKNKTE